MFDKLTEEAKELRRKYAREYRERNRERLNEKAKEWRRNNPEKCAEYRAKAWEKKAFELLTKN